MKILFSKREPAVRHKTGRLPVVENAFFWMFLLFLSLGCITSLYEKSLKEAETAVASSDSVFKSEIKTDRDYKVRDRMLPIYCVNTDKPQVALTFDAAWGNEDTRRLMDILADHKVKVTFFMTGEWVEKYPEDVKFIAEQGHELGNHSENHKNMSKLDKETIRTELMTVHDKVKGLTGRDMILFRPPYGDYNNNVVETVSQMGYYPIQWDVDSLDWKDYGKDSIVDKVLNDPHLGNGSIILMHNGAKYTPSALDAVIKGLKDKGFELVPVSSLIWKENFHLDQEGRQFSDGEKQNRRTGMVKTKKEG